MKTIACILLALCMTACSNGDDFAAGAPVQRHAASADREFGFDVQEFADAFNRAARMHDYAFHIDHVEMRHGALHDYFRQTFDTGLSLTATISKETGHITSVTALVEGSAEAARTRLLALAEVVMTATNPRIPYQKAVSTVRDMLDESIAAHDARHFPQRFIDQVRYGLRSDSGVGYWWIANPA